MSNVFRQNVQLAPFTSWLVGGEAEYFCLPKTIEDVLTAVKFAQEKSIPFTILGGGSNVLISDLGIKGLTICLKDLSGIQMAKNQDWEITALAGTSKSELLKFFLKEKLAPALFLAGLPGDLGGGVVMNAGVAENFKPREFCEIVKWIEVLRPDGKIEKMSKPQLHWGYRHCEGWQPGIIVRIGFAWPDHKDDSILVQVREANRTRLSKQPLDMPSCGSVFRNPDGKKAAQLIDSSGLKGYTVGQAQVSTKHANFIVNLGGARAADIWSVISYVEKTVQEKTGVKLKTEVIRLGEWA